MHAELAEHRDRDEPVIAGSFAHAQPNGKVPSIWPSLHLKDKPDWATATIFMEAYVDDEKDPLSTPSRYRVRAAPRWLGVPQEQEHLSHTMSGRIPRTSRMIRTTKYIAIVAPFTTVHTLASGAPPCFHKHLDSTNATPATMNQ